MARKISDWFCVGTSGPTVDGRELDPQWFNDAGTHYDPKTYTALIWYEHYHFWKNFGEIYAMKAEKQDDGTVKMFNRMIPSDELLELNRAGQKIFSSVEIVRNFAQRGHAYQIGLGITDNPASLSTDKLKFNALKEDDEFKQLCNGVLCERIDKYKQRVKGFEPDEIEIFIGDEITNLEFTKERKVFDLGAFLFGKKTKPETTQTHATKEIDIDMEKEEFKQLLSDAIAKEMQPFSDLASRVKKLEEKAENHSNGGKDEGAAAANNNDGDNDNNYATKDDFQKLMDGFQSLSDKLDATPAGDDDRPPADGNKAQSFSLDH